MLCLPKTALLDGARAAGFGRDVRASWSKPVLADFFVAAIPFDLAAKHCGARGFDVGGARDIDEEPVSE